MDESSLTSSRRNRPPSSRLVNAEGRRQSSGRPTSRNEEFGEHVDHARGPDFRGVNPGVRRPDHLPGDPPLGRPKARRGLETRPRSRSCRLQAARLSSTGSPAPRAMEVAPDGRVLVCEQTGALPHRSRGTRCSRKPFVTLAVDSHWERGLIGVALDPDSPGMAMSTSTPCRLGPTRTIGSVASPPRATSPWPGVRSSCSRAMTRTSWAAIALTGIREGPSTSGSMGNALRSRSGEQTAGDPAQAPSIRRPRANSWRSTPTARSRRTTRSIAKPEASIGRSGRSACATLSASRSSREPAPHLHQRCGRRTRWEEIDEGFAGANYGWPRAEGPSADARFRGPIHHYPVASVAGGNLLSTGARYRIPLAISRQVLLHGFRQGLDQGFSTLTTRSAWKHLPRE